MFWKYEKSDNIYFEKVRKINCSTAIIFIHGFGGSRNYWRGMQNSLANKYSLYFIDLLGFGFSKKPEIIYTLSTHINAVHTFISNYVEESNIIFVGHSLGAIIALGYTAKYPENVLKTILVSLPYYHNSAEARRCISEHSSLSFVYGDTLGAHISCHIVCMFRPFFIFISPLFARDKQKVLIKDSLYHTHQSYFSTLKNVVINQNLEKLLIREVTHKFVLVHGENDKLAPVSNIKELVKRFKLNSIILKNTGHDIPYTHSRELVKIINPQKITLNPYQGYVLSVIE